MTVTDYELQKQTEQLRLIAKEAQKQNALLEAINQKLAVLISKA